MAKYFLVFTTVKNMADQVILIKPLHHDNDDAVSFTVEATHQCVVVSVVSLYATRLRECIVRLEWIIGQGVRQEGGELRGCHLPDAMAIRDGGFSRRRRHDHQSPRYSEGQ